MVHIPIQIVGEIEQCLVDRQALDNPNAFEATCRELFAEYPTLKDLGERIIFSRPGFFSIVSIQPNALTTLLLDDDGIVSQYLGSVLNLSIPHTTLSYRMENGWLCIAGVGTTKVNRAKSFIHLSRLTSEAYRQPGVSLKAMRYLSVQH